VGEFDTVTVDDALKMMRTTSRLHDEVGQFLEQSGHRPRPGSQAATELSSFQRPGLVETAFSQGGILIEVAADQLMAFVRTVTEPVQTIAPWTCVRALIESSALAVWILDPKVDAATRVRRSLAFRFEGLVQQRKIGRVSGDEAGTAKVAARIDDLECAAAHLGFPRVENRSGKRIGVAQEMPSITNIVAGVLDEEVTYRLLSAVAHAHPWALQQLSFRPAEDQHVLAAQLGAGAGTGQVMEKGLSPTAVAFLCRKAVPVFLRPLAHKCTLFGWDSEHLKRIVGPVLNGLGIGPQVPGPCEHRPNE